MPTVLRQDGFRVMIYVDDHEPAHVHVFKGGDEVVINLGDNTTDPSLREVRGMSKKSVTDALTIVTKHQVALIAAWGQIHV